MISHTALSPRTSFPPPSNACQSRLRSPSFVIQALKGGRRGEDDYYSTLKALNSRGRIVPRKSLGQHYMLNSSINDQLSSIAGVVEGDVVLEIGPGTGSLTNVLINAGATVIAIEKDPRMALMVKERFGCSDQLTVLQEDITRCHIRSHVSALLERVDTKGLKYAKVVSNIPFNISTDVVKQLLPIGDLFSEVIILLQDEAALRLAGFQLHSSEYRPINLFVNFYSELPMISLKDIVPAATNTINTQFILVDKGNIGQDGKEITCLALVADETASVHFQLWGDECHFFEPGDMIRLTNGIFSYQKSNLVLRAGKKGKAEKVGEFNMVFVETPNMSEIKWANDPTNPRKFVKEAVVSSHSRIFPPLP